MTEIRLSPRPDGQANLRRQVNEFNRQEGTSVNDNNDDVARFSGFERRLQHLEQRIHDQAQEIKHMEITIVRQLESLTVAYQNMATNLDKMVTRAEFSPVKWISYLSAGAVFLMGLAVLLSRAGGN